MDILLEGSSICAGTVLACELVRGYLSRAMSRSAVVAPRPVVAEPPE